MDVAEGNSGAGNSGGGQPGEGTNNGPRGSGAGQGSEENSFTEPQNSTSKEDKPTEEVHGTGHDHVEASKNPQAAGQIMYMASSQSKGVMIEHEVSGTGIKGNGGDMQGKNVTAKSPKTNHKHGNSSTNLNRSTNKPNDATYKPDIIACDLSPHAALGSQLSVSLESPHLSDCGSNKYYRGDLGALATPVGSVLKGSKRREGSSDEDSSARAERLKAKRNLDGSVTLHSNSFLAFSDCKVEKNIATLVVSLGNNVASTIACLKESELNRLVQASSTEPRQLE
jgi:hypothetical protein